MHIILRKDRSINIVSQVILAIVAKVKAISQNFTLLRGVYLQISIGIRLIEVSCVRTVCIQLIPIRRIPGKFVSPQPIE